MTPAAGGRSAENPFVLYRHRLDSYGRWIGAGGDDESFVELVGDLDSRVAQVENREGGRGFLVTPVRRHPELAAAAGLADGTELWVKDETGNVSGSHKARHLFGLALHTAVDEMEGRRGNRELVIASCGNAALGAAVVASAARRPLRVFIPTWADEAVVEALVGLDATIELCERRDGEVGDPCYLRFREAVAAGAEPFSVQGTDVPRTLDGGRTIGWELADQFADAAGDTTRLDRVVVQVGGGALGTCLAAGLAESVADGRLTDMPRIHAVQTEAASPLRRAWDALGAVDDPVATLRDGRDLDRFMWPWEEVGESAATGILDDLTYDWVPLTLAMLTTGGWPLVVDESTVAEALRLGRELTGIDVDATGTAGLAGVLSMATEIGAGENVAVLFTGRRR